MVGLLALSAVDRGFEPRSGQTKGYKIGIAFTFSTLYSYSQKVYRRQSGKNGVELEIR
jgi:hypothetical protein